ncbi:hypothetical protein, partial [Leptospira interrogans]
MNKAPFFGKAVVPTFYPFARLCKTIWVKTNLLFILNRLTASKLYSVELSLLSKSRYTQCSTPNGIKVIFRMEKVLEVPLYQLCSTPTGIKVIFRKSLLRNADRCSGAQRLPASKLYSENATHLNIADCAFVLNAYRHPDFCKFDLRDAETFFFQSGSSHIY